MAWAGWDSNPEPTPSRALSSSAQVSPTYWLNPMNGVTYSLAVQAPQYRIESLQNLYELPIRGSHPTNQLLVNLATFDRGKEAAVVSHYNVQPVVDVYASVQGRDLGLARSVHHHNRPTRRPGRHFLDAICHGDNLERASPHGRHHVHRSRHGELDPRGHVRARTPGRSRRRLPRGARGRRDAVASGPHDGFGNDYRHGAHEPRTWRGRGAEWPARPRRDRWPVAGHRGDAVFRSGNLFPYPRPPPAIFQTQANSHDAARMNIIETPTQSKPSPSAVQPAKLSQAGPKENARRLAGRARALLFRSLIVAPVVIGPLIAARHLQFRNLSAETEKVTVPTVEVVHPTPGPSETEITLPGNLAPYSEASIYARTNGYLKSWKTDLGAKVAGGQLMAEISAPDVDAQLNQATANLAQAQANQTIAQLNFNRQQDLFAKAVSSRQEFD